MMEIIIEYLEEFELIYCGKEKDGEDEVVVYLLFLVYSYFFIMVIINVFWLFIRCGCE